MVCHGRCHGIATKLLGPCFKDATKIVRSWNRYRLIYEIRPQCDGCAEDVPNKSEILDESLFIVWDVTET